MRKIVLALASLLLVAAVACGEPNKLTEGEVIDRWIKPEWTQMVQGGCSFYTTVRSGSSTMRVCVAYNYYPVHHPSQYFLKIRGTHEGETLVETHRVSLDQWNDLQDGEHWVKR